MDMDKRGDKKRKYSSYEENSRTTDLQKRKKSRNYSNTSSSTESESEHSSSDRGKNTKKKKRKDRDKTKSNRKKEKRKKKREKKSKKQKEKEEKEEKKAAAIKTIREKDKHTNVGFQDSYSAVNALKKKPNPSDSGTSAAPKKRVMVPMTKEEYERQQAQVKRVYDPETGRHRLVKGTGEILEEIVSKARHNSINKIATRGDGEFFQANLGLQDK